MTRAGFVAWVKPGICGSQQLQTPGFTRATR